MMKHSTYSCPFLFKCINRLSQVPSFLCYFATVQHKFSDTRETRVPDEIQTGREAMEHPSRDRVRERVSRLKECDSPVCQKCEIQLLRERETPRRERERENERENERERER